MVIKLEDLPARQRSDSAAEFKKDVVRGLLTEQELVTPRRIETQELTTMTEIINDDLS